MPFEKHLEKEYARTAEEVYSAAQKAVGTLEGKIVIGSPETLGLEARFPKTILGKTLGERTHLDCSVVSQDTGSKVTIEAYPLDALERKLMFGARKGVTQTVVNWFVAHLEHHLQKSQE